MASRYKQTHPNMLEIRGLSRGSITENIRYEHMHPPSHFSHTVSNREHELKLKQFPVRPDSDDGSTITNGSEGAMHRNVDHSEDSMTESSHYWSVPNSFTTGNTTERSSVYSWGDDEFDYQASRAVKQMFHAIEKMLFESVLSGSPLLQHECREWMQAFPHLRILGKQSLPTKDEGYQSHPSSMGKSSLPSSEQGVREETGMPEVNLQIAGSVLHPTPVPMHYLLKSDSNSQHSGQGSEFSHLNEEIFEEDGKVEEYLAYDIREVDEEETAKRYHVPRRRRLGYPPITPNACVHDAVLNHLFDMTWAKLVSSVDNTKGTSSGATSRKNLTGLWKVLFGSHLIMKRQKEDSTEFYNDNYYKKSIVMRDEENFEQNHFPSIDVELPNSKYRYLHPHYMPADVLPSSRGSFLDPNVAIQGGRSFISPIRLSTAPYASDFTLLNDVMKISRKKLQVRTDKIALTPAMQSEEAIGTFGHNLEGGHLGISSTSAIRSSSPQGFGGRSYLPPTGIGPNNRQTSAKFKGRAGRPARLLPLALDRVKTPTIGFDGFVKATKLRISSSGPSNFDHTEAGGIRATSPPLLKPPTAPALSGGNLWTNSRLPPISLDPLNENSSVEFSTKKPRGRTALSRISSAVADDAIAKQNTRGWDGISRPNTTHAFRNDVPAIKRSTSVTPSNFFISNLGPTLLLPKSNSPSGIPVTIGSLPEGNFQNYSHSPDNQISGLSGITGIGMLGTSNSNMSQSHDHDDDSKQTHTGWGYSNRRKKTVLGT